MKHTRIYTSQVLEADITLRLEKAASHHCLKVLRLTKGANVVLFNGDGFEYLAEIVAIENQQADYYVLSQQPGISESPLTIHLAQGLARGQKMDYVIQKAVECGVSSITPILSERCGVKLTTDRVDKKLKHWQQVIVSACEQCGRSVVPTIGAPVDFLSYISQHPELKLMAHPAQQVVSSLPESLQEVSIMIGPEGGFTESEIDQAKKAGAVVLSLGPRVLRTETAALVAMTLLQQKFGDLML
jgi:16S rRNA (uracil1498-N3)-methyltransferase